MKPYWNVGARTMSKVIVRRVHELISPLFGSLMQKLGLEDRVELYLGRRFYVVIILPDAFVDRVLRFGCHLVNFLAL